MRYITILALIFTVSYLHAIDTKTLINELKESSNIENDSLRLNAYDSILEKNNLRTKPKNITKYKWEISIDTNPLDDTKTYVFFLIADEGISSTRKRTTLMIRKSSSGDEIFINWGSYLGLETEVAFRVGKAEAIQSQWSISTDGKATFYSGNALKLIRDIGNNEKVVAQCTPYGDNPITAIFDVRGLKEISKKYNNELGWFED